MFIIFHFLIKFSIQDYSDQSGIIYDSERKEILKQVPLDTLPENFVIPASVKEIVGKDYLTSAFYLCRKALNKVSFDDGSNLEILPNEVFMYSSINQIDFTNC